jgi:hypothetical protein
MIIHFNPALPLPQRKDLLSGFQADVVPAFA